MKKFIVFNIISFLFSNQIIGQTNFNIENVKAFAKTYGYVRYFYPSDEASSIDWDRFAIYGIESIINIQNSDSLRDKLNELFKPIAPLLRITKISDKSGCEQFIKPKTGNLKPISWQHYGFGDGDNKTYKSCRTNRPQKTIIKGNKKCLMRLDAIPYLNDSIKISAKIKIDKNSIGNGYLLMNLANTENRTIYLNAMIDNPISIKDSIIDCDLYGVVTNKAVKLIIGFGFEGNGVAEIIGFNLYHYKNSKWVPIDISKNNFEINKKTIIPYAKLPISMSSNDSIDIDDNIKLFNQQPLSTDLVNEKINDDLKLYECPLAYLKFIFVAYTSN
jgi:hypothetical protein